MTCWVGSSHSSHHPAKSVDLVPCEKEDKTFLIYYNIFDLLRDHVVKASRDFVGEVPSS